MRTIGDVLTSWQPAAAEGGDALAKLRAHWKEIVGEDIAANSRPAEIVRGALVVITRSGAWSQQLSFLSERIVQALRESGEEGVERLRFRAGRIAEPSVSTTARRKNARRIRAVRRDAAPTLEAAVDRFRDDVGAARRSKAAAGWIECTQCSALIPPQSERLCTSCGNARASERAALIARLLFEVPFLGFDGIKEHVDGLSRDEYETVRKQMLLQWWDTLTRLRRSGRTEPTKRERDIASSYVLLKSGLDPERIAPAVVRDLLGDELHGIFYSTENIL